MTADPLSLSPQATVQEAVLLLRSRGRLVLPVVEERQVIGIVDAVTVFMYQPDIRVSDIMGAPVQVDGETSLSAAAALMRAHCLCEMPVLDGGSIGVIKSTDLLSAWAMPVDPLTRLSWQDAFRLRSSLQLDAGKELTLLFFDMDHFGALNKRWGHVVGDRALQAVASTIRNAMDPATDEACRFGGDEFVVSTTRPRPEAEAWATRVQALVAEAKVEGLDDSLGVSVGIAGGLRQSERPGSHAPATLDDLINRASQASTQAKRETKRISTLDEIRIEPLSAGRPPDGPQSVRRPTRIRILDVEAFEESEALHATVRLEFGGETHTGFARGAVDDDLDVFGAAASEAVSHFLPARYSAQAVRLHRLAITGDSEAVAAVVRLEGPQGRQDLIGVASAAGRPRRAVVKAVLDALNRPLETLIQPLAALV